MTHCRVPWCILPGGHEAECVGVAPLHHPQHREVIAAFKDILRKVDAIMTTEAPEVQSRLIVAAIRAAVAELEAAVAEMDR